MSALSTHRSGGGRMIDGAATGSQMPPRVSIDNNQFTLIDPSGATTKVPNDAHGPVLDIVIVDRNPVVSKIFWGRNFNRAEATPPQCFSDNGEAPSSAAQDPQSPACSTCPHNVIGSAISQISGARIKACQDFLKLAVVVEGYSGVYQFTVKPGSFKAWNNYVNFLRLQKLQDGGLPDLCDVVTRVRFTNTGVLGFEPIKFPEGAIAEQAIAVWERNKTQDVSGMIVGKYDQPINPQLVHQPAQMPKQAAPPPPKQALFGGAIGPFPSASPKPAFPAQPAAPPVGQTAPTGNGEPKKGGRGRTKKEAEAPQAAQAVGIQTPQGAPPADVGARLDNLFKLPTK